MRNSDGGEISHQYAAIVYLSAVAVPARGPRAGAAVERVAAVEQQWLFVFILFVRCHAALTCAAIAIIAVISGMIDRGWGGCGWGESFSVASCTVRGERSGRGEGEMLLIGVASGCGGVCRARGLVGRRARSWTVSPAVVASPGGAGSAGSGPSAVPVDADGAAGWDGCVGGKKRKGFFALGHLEDRRKVQVRVKGSDGVVGHALE
ncbi:hypothetical protein BC939DRAFT_477548 [Gamsiella multidivaricata]|uniref:uncharacterized protein n=1 Tax=Gamsiella multidivaricata TaxID=101098 RepID=UPI002220C5FB|nr:uncharacterized protein BC939DRAFT_477548 [Gamsiella multidivaricata]KAI7822908.1 hypothetical protein BC939DRAFT_477548 [Gamsiella multidivaricata]